MKTPLQLQAFLHDQGLDSLVITRHANFAWLTGGRSFIGTGSDFGTAQIVVTPTEMVVVANNIEADRLTTEELPAGWRVVHYPWWADGEPARTVRSLVAGSDTVTPALGADGPFAGARDVSPALTPLRWVLSPAQQSQARQIGRETAEALEAVCRSFAPGETEAEIAARLGSALIARGIDPVTRLVAADERVFQWRHPLPTQKRVERYALVVVCGQRSGLVLSASRLVHFGPPPADISQRHAAAALVDATFIKASVPGASVAAIFRRAQAVYAAAGFPDEWQNHHQGGLAGFASREYRATPTTPHQVLAGQLFAWNPSVAGAKSEDTILVTENGPEIITATGSWPTVTIDGLARPDILIR